MGIDFPEDFLTKDQLVGNLRTQILEEADRANAIRRLMDLQGQYDAASASGDMAAARRLTDQIYEMQTRYGYKRGAYSDESYQKEIGQIDEANAQRERYARALEAEIERLEERQRLETKTGEYAPSDEKDMRVRGRL